MTSKKAYVGMSGGVDSSVSAALLKEAGYDVTGVFIKAWHPDFLECSWREDRRDAMRVCAELGIPFETCDLEEVYKREVVDYLIREYTLGRTPNPDVMCNRHIKFGAFFDFARSRGADIVATGHYARTGKQTTNGQQQTTLLRGVDTAKDQSYFLWTLSKDVLEHVMFPIGEYEKGEVRELATKFGLPVAEKKDSQGVCFMGHVNIEDFLRRFVSVTPGDVLNEDGDVVGRHEGALVYTIGHRHGFEVRAKKPDDGPHYVIAKDMQENTITVSQEGKVAPRFKAPSAMLEDVRWVSGTPPQEGKSLECRFRYRQPLVLCKVTDLGRDTARVLFDEPQAIVTPGQSLVVYEGDVCLGGGIITGDDTSA